MNDLEKALVGKALAEHVTSIRGPIDATARAMFEPGDQKVLYTTDESGEKTRIGKISMSEPKQVWKVTDPDAFLRWVAVHYPHIPVTETIVVSRVPEAWQKQAEKDGGVTDPATGEITIPDGMRRVSATPAFKVDPAPGLLQMMAAQLPELLAINPPQES